MFTLHASPLAQSALKNIKINYSPKLGHFANCLFFRQQMLGDPEFGHLHSDNDYDLIANLYSQARSSYYQVDEVLDLLIEELK